MLALTSPHIDLLKQLFIIVIPMHFFGSHLVFADVASTDNTTKTTDAKTSVSVTVPRNALSKLSFQGTGRAMNLLTWRVRIQAGRAWQCWSHGGAVHILPPLVSSSKPSACSLGDIHLRFTWQAWHLEASTLVLRGRRGTYGTGLALVACLGGLGRRWRRGTLRGRCLRFAWQAWHLVTSTFILRAAAALCLAGVAQRNIHCRSAWQAWHLETFICYLRGRCGTWRHLTACHLHGRRGFASQAWHTHNVVIHHLLQHLFAWQAWHLATSTFVSRGRRGTWRHLPWFCVAGVALVGIYLSTLVLRGRRGTYGTGLALVARLGGLGRRWRRGTLRGRRGTWRHPPSSCVAAAALCLADVAQRNTHRRFAWQAWHLETFICYLRGRCGTWRHPTACHLRGRRALGDIHFGFASQAWHTRRCHTPSFCVAGVALGDIHLRFAWQVWHLVTSTCCLHGIARHHALSFAYNCVTHTQLVTHHL